jgi:hypothetical protein
MLAYFPDRLLTTSSNTRRSAPLNGRNGTVCALAIALFHMLLLSVSPHHVLSSTYLRHDPLVLS